MKVIGMTGERSGSEYICTVSHTELEKLTDKYYGKLENLKVGDEMNLGAGYEFRSSIAHACKTMLDSMQAFETAKGTLTRFARMVAEHEEKQA